jgi:hypothetical protein
MQGKVMIMISASLVMAIMLSTFITGIQPAGTPCSCSQHLSNDYLVTDLAGEQLIYAINMALTSPVGADVAEYLTRRGYCADLDSAMAESHSWEQGTRQVLLAFIPFGDDAAMTYSLGICGKDSASAVIFKHHERSEIIETYTIKPDGVKSWYIITQVNLDGKTIINSCYLDTNKEFWYHHVTLKMMEEAWSVKKQIVHKNLTIVENWHMETQVLYYEDKVGIASSSRYINSHGDSETTELQTEQLIDGYSLLAYESPCDPDDMPDCGEFASPVCLCSAWDWWCLLPYLIMIPVSVSSCVACILSFWMPPINTISCTLCVITLLLKGFFPMDATHCCVGYWYWDCLEGVWP